MKSTGTSNENIRGECWLSIAEWWISVPKKCQQKFFINNFSAALTQCCRKDEKGHSRWFLATYKWRKKGKCSHQVARIQAGRAVSQEVLQDWQEGERESQPPGRDASSGGPKVRVWRGHLREHGYDASYDDWYVSISGTFPCQSVRHLTTGRPLLDHY